MNTNTYLFLYLSLIVLVGTTCANTVAVRTIYDEETFQHCTAAEWDLVQPTATTRRHRRNLRQNERELTTCNDLCKGWAPGTCYLRYPWCRNRRRLDKEEEGKSGRELFDFATECATEKASIESRHTSVYSQLSASCQAHVDTRTYECFAMKTSASYGGDDIHKFKLWNTDSGTVVNDNIVDGFNLCENEFNFSIEAVVGGTVERVKFELYGPDGYNYVHTEHVFPYTLFKNSGNQVNGRMIINGEYNLMAKPNGKKDKSLALRFNVLPSSDAACTMPAPTPSPTNAPVPAFTNWIETFDKPNGSTSDNDATSWTATRSTGTFHVQNGKMMVNSGGTQGVLTTDVINIAGTTVDISLDLYSVGDLESSQDYVRLYKVVDGGPEQLVGEKVGTIGSATTISGTGITGNNLKLVVRAYVSASNEYYYLDNLSIVKTPPSGCYIEQINLWNTYTDTIIDTTFSNGAELCVASTGYAFEVIATSPECNNIYMEVAGPSFTTPIERTEGILPYMSFGDDATSGGTGIPYGRTFNALGHHTFLAKPNGQANGQSLVTFNVVECAPPTGGSNCQIQQINLWNADTDTIINSSFSDGDTICKGSPAYAFEVIPSSTDCTFTYFKVTGPSFNIPIERWESQLPHMSFGDDGTNPNGKAFWELGQHTFLAKPNGQVNEQALITFNVVEC